MSIDPAAETARWLATISPEDLERAVAYTRGGHWLLLWGAIVSIVVAGWRAWRVRLIIENGSRPNRTPVPPRVEHSRHQNAHLIEILANTTRQGYRKDTVLCRYSYPIDKVWSNANRDARPPNA
jgi:hypothetical protein